jgi:TRAP-type uncharacterized transport system substrate-binding protein
MTRRFLRSGWFYFAIGLIGLVLLIVIGLWFGIDLLNPLPPRTVTMVTGAEGGAYHGYGERYRQILARQGIDLKLVPTAGAIDNLARLNDPDSGVSIGFVQGGTTGEGQSPQLQSLGTIFYEPLWFFHRSQYRGKGLSGLRGRRIAIGPEGSGTRALVLELLRRSGYDRGFAELSALSFKESADQLLRGEIDALFILASWDSPVVQTLLAADDIDLSGFPHTDAYVALYPFLTRVTVPAAVGSIVRNHPVSDTVLLATGASLAVRSDVHPAIQYLLLDAAEQVHSGPGIFRRAGQFPAAEAVDLPLSEEARHYYKSGPPLLQRYLPFWLAVLLGRVLLLILPLLGLLIPLFKLTPVLFKWQMQRRIDRLYAELREIENNWRERPAGEGREDLVAQLDQLEARGHEVRLPVSLVGSLYAFKEQLALVRQRLLASIQGERTGS